MGILSWLFPSDEDRLRKARDLMARGLYEDARRALVDCKAADAAALDDECSAAIDGVAASSVERRPRDTRARRKKPRASNRVTALPVTEDGEIVDDLPLYSALDGLPSRGLPADYAERTTLDARTEICRAQLLEPARRPPEDEPLFIELLAGKHGVVTIPLPDGGKCLPIFSTPVRAADYARTLLPANQRVQYLSTSPRQLTQMLRDLQEQVGAFVLDRCPRCTTLLAFGNDPSKNAGDAVSVWAILKSGELARADLFFACALEAAREGRLEVARDVALEAAGHVTLEDPRIHLHPSTTRAARRRTGRRGAARGGQGVPCLPQEGAVGAQARLGRESRFA